MKILSDYLYERYSLESNGFLLKNSLFLLHRLLGIPHSNILLVGKHAAVLASLKLPTEVTSAYAGNFN